MIIVNVNVNKCANELCKLSFYFTQTISKVSSKLILYINSYIFSKFLMFLQPN